MKRSFFVAGVPATKGSTKSFRSSNSRRIVTKSDNPRTKSWQRTVGLAARAAGCRPADGPIKVSMEFRLQRPLSHRGTGRNASTIRPGAPRAHTSKPDADKLIRAVLDGLTRVAWEDDAQVVEIAARKTYANSSVELGVQITLEAIGEEQAA